MMMKWSVVEVCLGEIETFGDQAKLVDFTLEELLLVLNSKPGDRSQYQLALVTMSDEGDEREFAWVNWDRSGPRLSTKFSDGAPVPWSFVDELERVAELLLAMWKSRKAA